MVSENSSKAKLGTAVALIGGAVGTGIVIYALMGPQQSQIAGEVSGTQDTQEQTASTTSTTQSAGTPSATPPTEPATTETPSAEVSTTGATATQSAETEPAEPEVEQEGVASIEPEATDTPEIETPNAETSEAADTDAVETDADASEVAESDAADGETETAAVETAQDDSVETDENTQAPAQPEIAQDAQSETEAPVVAALDPVMPGNPAPVVLETSATTGDTQPALDADDPSVPKFDLVRIEADGSAVIAGTAAPNSDVQIMSNGKEIGVAKASSKGEFVALLETEVNTTAQSLSLIANAPEAGKVTSQSNIIVLARSATETDDPNQEISLAPAIVEATRDEVRVIQPVVGLADLDRISLDTISYDAQGQVILAGRGRPNNTARIYADGVLLVDRPISGSGTWSAEINDLDAGRYIVRVDEIDAEGGVLSRVESPFQRIFPSAEQLALLTDASSVIVQPGNNLWTIAEGRYGAGIRYTTIFEANKEQIRDPDLIYPGQVFELPEATNR